MDFHQINGHNSIASMSTCHFSFSVPRQLADKRSDLQSRRSDLQSTTISDHILPSNSSKSSFHSKSKEVRLMSVAALSRLLEAVVPVLVLLFVALWFILRGDWLYVFPCVIFSSPELCSG